MASLLIIGGSGFFGKSILDAYKRGLLDQWGITSVKVLARNAKALERTNPELSDITIELINADISTCDVLPNADYVIHAAASTDAAKYLEQPEIEKANIQAATYNYCRLAPRFHQNSKIIYCSSGAVYGQQPGDLLHIPEDFKLGPVEEMHETKRDYAAAKRDSEKAIQELGVAGLNVSIARCFAFVGAYLARDQHFAIGNFIEDGLNSRPIQVKAKHAVYRSYMYADDLVHWLMTIAENATPDCPVFNVGSDEPNLLQDIAEMISIYFKVPTEIALITSTQVDRYIPSVEKAKSIDCLLTSPLDLAIEKSILTLLKNHKYANIINLSRFKSIPK